MPYFSGRLVADSILIYHHYTHLIINNLNYDFVHLVADRQIFGKSIFT